MNKEGAVLLSLIGGGAVFYAWKLYEKQQQPAQQKQQQQPVVKYTVFPETNFYKANAQCYGPGAGPTVEDFKVTCATDPQCKGFNSVKSHPGRVACVKNHIQGKHRNPIVANFYLKHQSTS